MLKRVLSHSPFVLKNEHTLQQIQANEVCLQMIKRGATEYGSQALNVIVALLEDTEDEVANAAVCGLSPVSKV